MTYSVTVAALLTALTLSAAAPRTVIEPAQPKWGDRIRILYHSDAAGAKLHNGDAVTALVTIWYPETLEQQSVPMHVADGHLEGDLTIPANASFVKCYLVTKDAFDGPAAVKVWNPDGRPARGAWHTAMTQPFLSTDYRERAAKELAQYPDNWSVYRDIWFLAAKEPDRAEGIRKDMALIAKGAPDRPLTALYALTYGYLLLGQEAEARREMAEMVRRFPDRLLTFWSLGSYEYEAQVEHFSGDGPKEVRAWHLDFLRRNPQGMEARSDVDSIGNDSVPVETMEAICQGWIHEDPRNPKPYIALVEAWQRTHGHGGEALAYAETALTLLLEGELRLHGDLFGNMTEIYIPVMFGMASDLSLEGGKPLAALAYAKAAESIGPQTRPGGFASEAKVWESLGHPSLAAGALKEAWQRGDQAAYQRLQEQYRQFLGTPNAAPAGAKKAAPVFQGTALDGSALDSAGLRGKVIVANFWFTGCGPCKAEIPDLNKLVAEFQGKDVVFLGFTLDDDPAVLQRFLKEHPFQYTIVPKSEKIADAFGIKVFPSHVIVGADGKVESMLEGGGENSANALRTVIARLTAQ